MDTIIVKATYTLNSLFKLFWNIMYRKVSMILFTVLGVVFIFSGFIAETFFGVSIVGQANTQLIVGILFIVGPTILAYLQARQAYHSTSHFRETIEYEFSPDGVKTTAPESSSFNSWNKVYKVVELEGWFLIYLNRVVFNPVPKKDFDKGSLELLRIMLRNVSGLRLKLKS
jgi:hypothetical protein